MQKTKYKAHPTLFNNTPLVQRPGQLSVVVGDYFEEASLKLFNLKRLCINSTHDVCPDLCNEEGSFFIESKASNLKSGGIAVKKDQVYCYRDLVDFHFPDIYDINPVFKIDLKYCLWFYDADLQTPEVDEIREILSTSIKKCIVVNFDVIWDLMRDSTVRFNKRIKYNTILKSIKDKPKRRTMRTLNVYDKETLNFEQIEVQ